MSGQHGQGTPARLPKSSPNFVKQGPMKATIPMSSLLKQSSSLKKSNSPTLSPTSCWKARISPDHSSGQRSPGSSACKVKSKTLGVIDNSNGNAIRRTSSLDTIYLKGHWPRDNFYWHTGILQIDKATQTDDPEWLDPRKIHCIVETNDDTLEKKIIRQRLQRNNKEGNFRHIAPSGDQMLTASSQTNTSCILSPTLRANPVNIPLKPLSKPTMRSSVEGLNQEIERLVLKSVGTGNSQFVDRNEEYDKFCQITPEGHRAPLADLLRATRSRSVNTQTPVTGDFTGSCHSSGPPSRGSLSPLIPGHLENSSSETGGSQGSSPDQESSKLGTSPHINRFLEREPPDGCEKVHLKSLDERRGVTLDHAPQPCTFQLKPSLGSAFKILQPNLHTSDCDLPLVPSQQDLI